MNGKTRRKIGDDIRSIRCVAVGVTCLALFSCSLLPSPQVDMLTAAKTFQPNNVVAASEQMNFKLTPDYIPNVRRESLPYIISVEQVHLLEMEAIRVQARIQNLKAALSQTKQPLKRDQLIAMLRNSLNEGLKAVKRTERSFNELGRGMLFFTSGKAFFADLQASYRHALEDLNHAQAQSQIEPRLQNITFQDEPRYPALAQGPLRVLEQNELAYSVVANKKDLTFNLEVNSVPAGAAVFFWRRGDSERKSNKPTNSTVNELPYAIWFVRFQLPGYKDEEREHDPFRESNHVLNVELHKQ